MKAIWTAALFVATLAPGVFAEAIELRPGQGVDGSALEPYVAHYKELPTDATQAGSGRERSTRLERIRVGGNDAWRLGITMLGQEGTVYDEVQMMADTFEPVMRYVSALTLLHQVEVYAADGMKGYRVANDGSSAQPLDIQPDGKRFGGPVAPLVLAGRALESGMTFDLPTFSTDMGPDGANLVSRVRVLGRETVEAAGRSWSTWVIETELLDAGGEPLKLPNGVAMPRSKNWIASEPPYGIRSQWSPASVVELVEVR